MESMRIAICALVLCAALPSLPAQAADDTLVYIGTYTGAKSKGIYAFRMDSAGRLSPLGLAAEVASPSFLAIHPNGKVLYAVSETEGPKGGVLSAYTINRSDGKLTLLGKASTVGSGPCFVSTDSTGKAALVANYGGGSLASFPLDAEGRPGEATTFIQNKGKSVNPGRQEAAHAHSIQASPDNRFALAADLGLDEVLVFHLDPAKATLVPNRPPFASLDPGSGPRHFAFHPNGKVAYVINELKSTVTVFDWDAAKGVLSKGPTLSTLPADFSGENTTAEVQVHPSGRFVYGSNRGHNSIAVFRTDDKGRLTPVGQVSTGGKTPRNFRIDPSGSFLLAANQDSDSVVVFKINQQTGMLQPTGQKVEVGKPVCVKFVR
jgi:6-phosphogluconolactonase